MKAAALCFGLLLLMGLVDYASGYEVRLGSIYLLLTALAAWRLRPVALVCFVLTTVVVWTSASLYGGEHDTRPWVPYWNVFNLVGSLSITAVAVLLIKRTLQEQQRLIREMRKTALDARQLREMVPVCRVCHTMRRDSEYEASLIENVLENPEYGSVGSVCPTCLNSRLQRLEEIRTGVLQV